MNAEAHLRVLSSFSSAFEESERHHGYVALNKSKHMTSLKPRQRIGQPLLLLCRQVLLMMGKFFHAADANAARNATDQKSPKNTHLHTLHCSKGQRYTRFLLEGQRLQGLAALFDLGRMRDPAAGAVRGCKGRVQRMLLAAVPPSVVLMEVVCSNCRVTCDV